MAALTRRGFVAALSAAGGALGAVPAAASPSPAPALRPGNAAPVRAVYRDTMAYFDFNGAAPAKAMKAKAQARLEDLPAEKRWLLGIS